MDAKRTGTATPPPASGGHSLSPCPPGDRLGAVDRTLVHYMFARGDGSDLAGRAEIIRAEEVRRIGGERNIGQDAGRAEGEVAFAQPVRALLSGRQSAGSVATDRGAAGWGGGLGMSGVSRSCTALAWFVGAFMLITAAAAEKLVFGTNWKAEAEHGGFYQALAEGRYAKYGLDVEIREGGPMVNVAHRLAAGALDAAMISNNAQAINFVLNDIPMVTVAAFFQKDPQVLLVHPGSAHRSIASMKGRPIMISADTRETWWRYLKFKFGFTDAQIRPYTFQTAPFLVDKQAIQQGYVTSEPFMLAREGIEARVFLVADAGWPSYSTLVTVSQALAANRPKVVQAFVNASIEGWYSYLYGDPRPGNRLILAENPEMTGNQIAYGIAKMKEHGIVDSGDAPELGIGAMTEARLQAFFEMMAKAGVYSKTLNHRAAFDLRFVNRGHALDMRP